MKKCRQDRLSEKKPQLLLYLKVSKKCINEAMEVESWVHAMQEELDQFKRNQEWTLVETPKNCSIFGIK